MTKYALAAFLLLFGVVTIFNTEIPKWVLGVVALAAGVVCVVDRKP